MSSIALADYGSIRVTEDNRFSVFDTIEVVGGKRSPREVWKRLSKDFPEVFQDIDSYKFPGRGQQKTPVATKEQIEVILDLLPSTSKKVNGKRVDRKSEEYYRTKLHKSIGGETEVCTPAGRIDILTPLEIIEVKAVNSWKSALGQIEVYADYYPSHVKRIHLFGACHKDFLDLITKHCKKRSIKVTWEA